MGYPNRDQGRSGHPPGTSRAFPHRNGFQEKMLQSSVPKKVRIRFHDKVPKRFLRGPPKSLQQNFEEVSKILIMPLTGFNKVAREDPQKVPDQIFQQVLNKSIS